ncbi:alkaline phosphatase family protein [Nocardia bovistercoris]|uniref:Alkaline phosphatase family protein n=1 Tax=Nocardia bovistercoris TaxID=2785916 RepID=A0A931I7R7_9NOCA|nr:alkaline phosphatase family protein [Nocardia bovistercoris]MBH0774963.1 alkaline phosphatase family protein [Nocardia bovistercoris]
MDRRQLLATTVAVTGAALLSPVAAVLPSGVARAAARRPKVVLIGIDGLLHTRIEPSTAPNLTRLGADGLFARGSLGAHISISGPSWATVLTGVWDSAHGITGNSFDARPFAAHPTVFTRLRRARPELKTHSIATWDMIAVMAGSGDPRAGVVVTTAPFPGDGDESRTDARTAADVVTAVTRYAPDFLFTHLDQVDHAGHFAGGARSPAYVAAITRVDELVGRIVAAVDARAAAEPDEAWTILVTTDHGHRPEGGHGGRTPDETATFVIARGPDFPAGALAEDITLADLTPTVLDLFAVQAEPAVDGRSFLRRSAARPAESR